MFILDSVFETSLTCLSLMTNWSGNGDLNVEERDYLKK